MEISGRPFIIEIDDIFPLPSYRMALKYTNYQLLKRKKNQYFGRNSILFGYEIFSCD